MILSSVVKSKAIRRYAVVAPMLDLSSILFPRIIVYSRARDLPPGRLKRPQNQQAAHWAACFPLDRVRSNTWLLVIHLTRSFHLIVLLHHFLPHLLPFGLLVGRQDGVHLLD